MQSSGDGKPLTVSKATGPELIRLLKTSEVGEKPGDNANRTDPPFIVKRQRRVSSPERVLIRSGNSAAERRERQFIGRNKAFDKSEWDLDEERLAGFNAEGGRFHRRIKRI